jgi:hypothetical protein
MATVPTPLTPIAGDKLSAAGFNSGVTDVLNWLLTNYPKCGVNANGALIPATNVLTLIPFTNETYDTDNMHDSTTNNSRIVFNTSGYYEVDFWWNSNAGASTDTSLRVTLNAAGAAGGGSTLRTQQYSDGVRFNGNIAFRFTRLFTAGDYVEFFIASTLGLTGSAPGLGSRVFARWISN